MLAMSIYPLSSRAIHALAARPPTAQMPTAAANVPTETTVPRLTRQLVEVHAHHDEHREVPEGIRDRTCDSIASITRNQAIDQAPQAYTRSRRQRQGSREGPRNTHDSTTRAPTRAPTRLTVNERFPVNPTPT